MLPSSLSYLSSKCVLGYLDVGKRIQLILVCPSIQSTEKRTPLHLDYLRLEPSDLYINDIHFQFGTIKKCKNRRSENKKLMEKIKGWRATEEDQLLPGDLKIMRTPKVEDFDFETLRFERIQKFREAIFLEVQKYLDNPEGCQDPLDQNFEHEHLSIDNSEPNLYYSTFSQDILTRHSRNSTNDSLRLKFPRAYDYIQKKFLETKNSKNSNHNFYLLKILHEPLKFESQDFLIFKNRKNSQIRYLRRLPYGLSVRQAFKKFATWIFGGRLQPIHVERLCHVDFQGILGLPENFKIAPRKVKNIVGENIDQDMVFRGMESIISLENFKELKMSFTWHLPQKWILPEKVKLGLEKLEIVPNILTIFVDIVELCIPWTIIDLSENKQVTDILIWTFTNAHSMKQKLELKNCKNNPRSSFNFLSRCGKFEVLKVTEIIDDYAENITMTWIEKN